MATTEDDVLKKKAHRWDAMAAKAHPFYRGKIEVIPKCPVRDVSSDFAVWYTPGVAKPCRLIHENPDAVYDHTNKWNQVAIVSDGTRVLGLGNIGPAAAMPVMEGKAMLFKYLGGVDAFPICLGTRGPEELITACKWLEPTFGGINLEDISSPECFSVLDRLRKDMDIPVWHDDQQGTAAVITAGAMNALKVVGKRIGEVTVSMIGSGAANIRTAWILIAAGVNPANIVMTDSKGCLHQNRTDLEATNPYKWELCLKTNGEAMTGDSAGAAMKGTDICIAASRPGPGTIKPEWVSGMGTDPIVFACANPVPEIWPWEARKAGAKIVATGRSDFPNQINNSLGFPGIFRGALDVRASTITDEMCIAAARELARCAEDRGLTEGYIIPSMDEWEVYPREAAAVGLKAIDQGIAKVRLSRQELLDQATSVIKRTRGVVKLLMDKEFIRPMAL